MTLAMSTIATTNRQRRVPRGRPTPAGDPRPSVGFVSTFPPTKCGLATFTASLAGALSTTCRTGVVSCVDTPGQTASSPGVAAEWVRGSPASLHGAVRVLDGYESVIVQHEFGLFGGQDGDEILELVSRVASPVVVVLHTVLETPSDNQRRIVEELAAKADRVVAQSEVARDRLVAAHDIDASRVSVIQHGAPANIARPILPHDPRRRPVILTWGLLGPGKGIEYAIEALAGLRDLDPVPRYVVLGQTHPNIVRDSGEAYRESLQARAAERGVADMVEFDNAYRDTAEILAEIRKADVVLLPYLSRDQVVSGVLVEAIASAKPVVSTAFPHAVELLAAGSGIVVPHEDPVAIASALRTLLTDRTAAAVAAAVARVQAASLTWETVASHYRELTRGAERTRALAG
jgi:glycosyltransferase involved in cell wall biosynthesis